MNYYLIENLVVMLSDPNFWGSVVLIFVFALIARIAYKED